MNPALFPSSVAAALLVVLLTAGAHSRVIAQTSSAPENCAQVHVGGLHARGVLARIGLGISVEPLSEGLGGSLWLGRTIRSDGLNELVSDSVWLDLRGRTVGFAVRSWDDPPIKADSLTHDWRVFGFSESWEYFGPRGREWLVELDRHLEAEGVLRFRVISGPDTGWVQGTKCDAIPIM